MSLLFEPIRRERSGYVYCGKVSSNNLKNFCLLFIIISVMYTVAIIPYVNGAFNAIDAVAYHDEMLEQGGVDVAHGNPILVKVFAFQEMLRPVFTFLTCYILCDNRFNSKFKITLCANGCRYADTFKPNTPINAAARLPRLNFIILRGL